MSNDSNDIESLLNDAAGSTSTQKPVRKGNEVFSEQNKMIEVSRDEYAKREFGIEIPTDAVPLPSRGLVYPVNHPLHQAEYVEYKAMTAREEDILMSRALIKKGTMITELIKSSLVNKNIDVNSLLSGDRATLMIAIRSSGYGKDYTPSVNCPSCQFKNEMNIDLAELPIKPLGIEPVEIGQNVFEYILPVSRKKIHFKFLTAKDEEIISQELESKKKRGQLNDNVVTTQLLSTIIAIDGNSNRNDIVKFVSYMPAMDSREFRKFINDNEPGLDLGVEFQCKACDYVDTMTLPMGSEFFWPGSKR